MACSHLNNTCNGEVGSAQENSWSDTRALRTCPSRCGTMCRTRLEQSSRNFVTVNPQRNVELCKQLTPRSAALVLHHVGLGVHGQVVVVVGEEAEQARLDGAPRAAVAELGRQVLPLCRRQLQERESRHACDGEVCAGLVKNSHFERNRCTILRVGSSRHSFRVKRTSRSTYGQVFFYQGSHFLLKSFSVWRLQKVHENFSQHLFICVKLRNPVDME